MPKPLFVPTSSLIGPGAAPAGTVTCNSAAPARTASAGIPSNKTKFGQVVLNPVPAGSRGFPAGRIPVTCCESTADLRRPDRRRHRCRCDSCPSDRSSTPPGSCPARPAHSPTRLAAAGDSVHCRRRSRRGRAMLPTWRDMCSSRFWPADTSIRPVKSGPSALLQTDRFGGRRSSSHHSSRNATMGSMRAARCAGT